MYKEEKLMYQAKLTLAILILLTLLTISSIVNAQSCSSTRDYETGLKNGLKMAPPCDLPSSKLPRCNGEYNTVTWSNCYGERTTANGSTYRGGYVEGKANGKGEFVNPDGTRYLGDYDKGQRNGYGKEYAANGLVLNEGQWNNGILVSNAQKAQSSQSQQTTNVSTQSNDQIGTKMAECAGWFIAASWVMRDGGNTRAAADYMSAGNDSLGIATTLIGKNRVDSIITGMREYNQNKANGTLESWLPRLLNKKNECQTYMQTNYSEIRRALTGK
jgi:hypothetical protein